MKTIIQNFCQSPYSSQAFAHLIHKCFDAELMHTKTYKQHGDLRFCEIAHKKTLDQSRELAFLEFEVSSIDAKVSLHKELKKLSEKQGFDAILAVFVNPKYPQNFRMSLLTSGWDFENAKPTYSHPKRQSFLLGKDIKTNSAERQLSKLQGASSLEDIEEAFSLEPITKEFYKEILKHYTSFHSQITFPTSLTPTLQVSDKDKSPFILRLISRILFCKFLEKKLAQNGIELSKLWNLDELDSASTDTSTAYYSYILEPLFYQTLNTPQPSSPKETRSYSFLGAKAPTHLLASKELQELLDSIPYLNGGLFEPQDTDFYGDRGLIIPDSLFRELFSTLERYHFTIDESTPTDQEVGLDPEMLGMVFERLLGTLCDDEGSVRSSDALSKQKTTGSYYTPREIVSYMCKSTLLAYLAHKLTTSQQGDSAITPEDKSDQESKPALESSLKNLIFFNDPLPKEHKHHTDTILKALSDFKVLDPACGSGAFPMGMLQELTQILQTLDPDASSFLSLQPQDFQAKIQAKKSTPSYIFKLAILQNCIYGVDIQPMATEISRLRCFLSLICDEDSDKIEPLPNLEFKFLTANSLMPLEANKEQKLKQQTFDGREAEALITQLKNIYTQYITATPKDRQGLKDEFYNVNKSIKSGDWLTSEQIQILESFDPFNSISKADFFDSAIMFGVEKFDCVIGNPPYIKEAKNKDIFATTKHLRTYQGKMDLWYHFAGRALEMLKDGGVLNFIATNNWTTNSGASKLRNILLEETRFISLIDFGDHKVFESAGIQTMIMSFKKEKPPTEYSFDYRKSKKATKDGIYKLLEKIQCEQNICATLSITPKHKINRTLTFCQDQELSVLSKIINSDIFYLSKDEIQIGIGLTDKVKKSMRLKTANIGDGIFQLNTQEINKLNLSKQEMDLIKPLYTTNELSRYWGDRSNKEWVIYTNSSFKNPNSMDNFPQLKYHLDKFQQVIGSDNKPYGLHRAKKEYFFNQTPSIVSLRKCPNRPSFTYVNFPCYVTSTFFIIQTKMHDMKYLTGILNSACIAYWLKHMGKMQGNAYQIDGEPLLNIPIPKIDSANQSIADKIIALVDEILATKDKNPKVDITKQEKQIDKLVYKLYNLNDEEIEIIEGAQ